MTKKRKPQLPRSFSVVAHQVNADKILEPLFPSSELVTDELIAALVDSGLREEDLLFLRDAGFRYCRERNSFVSPPGFLQE